MSEHIFIMFLHVYLYRINVKHLLNLLVVVNNKLNLQIEILLCFFITI